MKKQLLLLLVAGGLSQTAISQNCLTSDYPFNGNANDHSGTNNGTVTGANLVKDRFNNANAAYDLTGANDYISITDDQSLRFSDSFSISLWIKTSANYGVGPNYHALLGKWGGTGAASYLLCLTPTGNVRLLTNDGVNNASITTTEVIPVNKWSHITAIQDKADYLIYVDGKLVEQAANAVEPKSTTSDILIGVNTIGGGTDSYNGLIDDIGLYSCALDSNEVKGLFTKGVCLRYDTITHYDTVLISVMDTLVINAVLTGITPPNNFNFIKVYPNPANTQITIDNGDFVKMSGYTVKIVNSLGQTVFEKVITQQSETINLSNWTGKGLYFLHILDGQNNTIDIRKIVLK